MTKLYRFSALALLFAIPMTNGANGDWTFIPDLYQVEQCSSDGSQTACKVPSCGATNGGTARFNYLSFRYHATGTVPAVGQIIVGCADSGGNVIAGPTLGANILTDGQCVTPCPEGYFIGSLEATDDTCTCVTIEGPLAPVPGCNNIDCTDPSAGRCGGTGLCA